MSFFSEACNANVFFSDMGKGGAKGVSAEDKRKRALEFMYEKVSEQKCRDDVGSFLHRKKCLP